MRPQETKIYQQGLQLISTVREALQELPSGYGFLADQLRRASSSVVLNFAEGYGKLSRAEQRRFFGIAKGSANEVMAVFDTAYHLAVISQELQQRGVDQADHIAAMLTRFIKRRE